MRRRQPVEGHPCAAVGCQHLVQPGFLMCMDHWRQVPSRLQSEVWTSYRELKRRFGDAAAAQRYQVAKKAAVDAVHAKQLNRKAKRDSASGSLF